MMPMVKILRDFCGFLILIMRRNVKVSTLNGDVLKMIKLSGLTMNTRDYSMNQGNGTSKV